MTTHVHPAMAAMAVSHTYTISAAAPRAVIIEDRHRGWLHQSLVTDDDGPAMIPPGTLRALVAAGNEERRQLHEAEAVCARLVEVICSQEHHIGLLEQSWEIERDKALEAAWDLRNAITERDAAQEEAAALAEGVDATRDAIAGTVALLAVMRARTRGEQDLSAAWDAVVDDWTAATETHIVRGES